LEPKDGKGQYPSLEGRRRKSQPDIGGETAECLHCPKGSVRKAYKLSKDRVPVGKKITDVTYTPPIRGRR